MTDRFDDVREALAKMTPGDWETRGPTYVYGNLQRDQNETADRVGATITASDAAGIVTLKNRTPAMLAELDATRAKLLEQARLNGMGAEREAKLLAERDALAAEVARLRPIAEDALKALPVLRTMLESAGLAAGVIVAEGMISHARAALEPRT